MTFNTRSCSYLIAIALSLACFFLHLVPALLSGLLVYTLLSKLACRLQHVKHIGRRATLASIILLGSLLVTTLSFGMLGLVAFLRSSSLSSLTVQLLQVLDATRHFLPSSIAVHLPVDVPSIENFINNQLHAHLSSLQHLGQSVGLLLIHLLFGSILGLLVAISATNTRSQAPLAVQLRARVLNLANAFTDIVFAQIKIAAINAVLTGLYLLLILPLSGHPIPMAGTLVIVTFLLGLIPVLGNLVSNSLIVLASLAVSPGVALASLLFLVGIHKLEYFLNGMIVGRQLATAAWEILLAMLVLEAAFGLSGLIAAPVMYGWLRRELVQAKMV